MPGPPLRAAAGAPTDLANHYTGKEVQYGTRP